MSNKYRIHPMYWPGIIAVLAFIALLANTWEVCGSQWKDTINNLLIGAITSSMVVFLVTAHDRVRWFRAFAPLAGGWEEYEFDKNNGRKLEPVKSGHACISHQSENTLSLRLTQEKDKRVWDGQIIMSKEYPHTGRIVFHYEAMPDDEHEFGLKEVIHRSDEAYDYLYFVSINYAEPLKGQCANGCIRIEGTYGKTVLRRKKRTWRYPSIF
jgi:hypothetical protein